MAFLPLKRDGRPSRLCYICVIPCFGNRAGMGMNEIETNILKTYTVGETMIALSFAARTMQDIKK
jgi:hypothetical protein